jgi:valyl-tRNA synthetase
LGDVAIFVNPTDERYMHLIGKQVTVPIINRTIPIIADEYVAVDFGTGALKVTPAHDKNDNILGAKHGLKSIDTLDATGKFTVDELMDDQPSAQILGYIGLDRFVLRKKLAEDINALGQLTKIEEYKGQVGTSERTGAVIENRLSMQWFLNMQAFMERNPQVLNNVLNDTITFHPAKLKNTYKHWLENIKDWCISRQLWWGQRIPAWYDAEGRYVVAENEEKAKAIFKSQFAVSNAVLKQDEDVLDTWFSSWLWPMEVFKGISNPNNEEANYYYPSTTLVTGQDIIFFWVARMIMAGYEYKKFPPFKDVYFTGMVRDKQGRKMSKQLGNSPDLLEMIEKDGADAVRFGIMISSPAGNDLMWDPGGNEQGKFFINKIWNALRLIKMWEGKVAPTNTTTEYFAVNWFENRLTEVKIEVEAQFKEFRLSESLKTIYSLIWDDFCSWYLEWIKPPFINGESAAIDKKIYEKTIFFFEELMQLLHPFLPFITEEVYHQLKVQENDLTIKPLSPIESINQQLSKDGGLLKEVITAIRDARNKAQLKPKETIRLHILASDIATYQIIEPIISKQVNAESITYTKEAINNSITVVVQKDKFFIETTSIVDAGVQKEQLQKDLDYLKGFLLSVDKKLSNEKFVQNAKPDVIEIERKKKADAEAKIKMIEESLRSL